MTDPRILSDALTRFSFATHIDPRHCTLHSRRLMLSLSHVIEDVAASVSGTLLIAAFQRLSLVRPQLPRYERLVPDLTHTYLLGLPDLELPAFPQTTIIPIESSWPLMHEWVVLASGVNCCAGLFARDSDQAQPDRRTQQFQGLWTTDPLIVDTAIQAFHTALGWPVPSIEHDAHALYQTTRRLQHELASRVRSTR